MTDTSPNLVAADILDRTAGHIDQYGWIQGDYFAEPHKMYTTACCVSGALRITWSTLEGPAVNQALRDAMNGMTKGALLSTWNDEPGRTKEEVVTALHDAAAYLRGEE